MSNFQEDYRKALKGMVQFVLFLAAFVVGFSVLYIVGSVVFAIFQAAFYVTFGIATVMFLGLIALVFTMGNRFVRWFDSF